MATGIDTGKIDDGAVYRVAQVAAGIHELNWFGGIYKTPQEGRAASRILLNTALAARAGSPLNRTAAQERAGVAGRTARDYLTMLIRQGYLDEKASARDARQKILHVTAKAERWLRECAAKFIEDNADILALPARDREIEEAGIARRPTEGAAASIDEEIERYSAAIRAKPTDAHAHAFRGKLHFENGDYDAALSDSLEARRLYDGHFSAMLTCARIAMRRGETGEAVDLFRNLVHRRRMDSALTAEFADALERGERYEEAIEVWRSLLFNSDPVEGRGINDKLVALKEKLKRRDR